jgi:hypothetical protein
MTAIIDFILGAPLIIKVVIGVLIWLAVMFIFLFAIKAMYIWVQLSVLSKKLHGIKGTTDRILSATFSGNKLTAHLWKEYRDTLHEQREFDSKGKLKPIVLRSTIPAAAIFTTETLVDSRLATEFFKHLPGLFTGIGIIGTFWGLIQGLQAFRSPKRPKRMSPSCSLIAKSAKSSFSIL